ncbi:MAG: tetratricopeptide repeat protein [Prevotella sp.]|nr:tetratricopeptide repeat protein [Candidatus Prevotella equi]
MSQSKERTISIIVTPTFGTVQDERNYLMTTLFPHLMQLADEHQVAVELKWETSIEIIGVHEIRVSLVVDENPHPLVFVKKPADQVSSDRIYTDGVRHIDYATNEVLGRNIEKAFVRLLDKLFPVTTPVELAKALRKVATIYRELGQTQEAYEMLQRALNVLVENFGEQNPDTIEAHYQCGWLLYRLNRFDESIAQLTKACELATETFNESDPRITDYIGVLRLVKASAK